MIYIVLAVLVLSIPYGIYLLIRVKPEWIKTPGRNEWTHKGGGKVVANTEQSNAYVAMYRLNTHKGPLYGYGEFKTLQDAQAIVEKYYGINERSFKQKFKWVFIVLGYCIFTYSMISLLYYLTLIPWLPMATMSYDALNWYKFGGVFIIILVAPAFIVWRNWKEIKLLWNKEEE